MPTYLPWSAAALAAGLAVAGTFAFWPTDDRAYAAIDLPPMTTGEAARSAHLLTPLLLGTVYAAFSETTEVAIYDTLAEVAANDALEALYLERVGAMADGGLDQSDQTIHEIELMRLDTRQGRDRLDIDARWRVIGTVGHDAHMHVRGNVYEAGLVVEPVEGIWRFTDFTLRDVDRTGAGEIYRVPVVPGLGETAAGSAPPDMLEGTGPAPSAQADAVLQPSADAPSGPTQPAAQ